MIQQLLNIVTEKSNKALAARRLLLKPETKLVWDNLSQENKDLFYNAILVFDLRTAKRILDENMPLELHSTNQLRLKAKQKCVRNYYKLTRQSLLGALKK